MSEYLIFTVVFSCSYNGVYASPEQRVAGGGCLDLTRMVEEELGLEEGAITGTWDIAHNLQIVWKNGLSEHEAELKGFNWVTSTLILKSSLVPSIGAKTLQSVDPVNMKKIPLVHET